MPGQNGTWNPVPANPELSESLGGTRYSTESDYRSKTPIPLSDHLIHSKPLTRYENHPFTHSRSTRCITKRSTRNRTRYGVKNHHVFNV